MPRRARLSVAGVPRHIIQRVNNRSVYFFSDEDYQYYLDTLNEQARKYGCSIRAYVLMTHHVHLLLTPEEKDSVALLMKNLGLLGVHKAFKSAKQKRAPHSLCT